MSKVSRRLVLLFPLALGAAAACDAASPLPTPGQYRIDGEATTRTGSGPTAAERVERWDGASGDRTVTSHAGPPGNPAARQTYVGSGPVTWCVPPASTPPADLPDPCRVGWWPAAATLQADCQAGRLQERWRQPDAKTWERQMTLTAAPGAGAGAGAGDPAAALALAQRGMSPAAAAQAGAAVAALPGAQAHTDAMAPVHAQIEATIRNGSPEEAAAARQQLAALKAAQGGGGPSTVTTFKERWTRIADTCAAGS